MRNGKLVPGLIISLFLGGAAIVAMPAFCTPALSVLAAETSSSDAELTSAIEKQLRNKEFKNVTVLVSGDVATLSGQVELYGYKESAVKKSKKVRGVKAIRDNIAVGGPTFPDAVLQRKLLNRIQVDRIGFGQVFDAISVGVQNGVVTLGGHALGPVAKESALSLTSYTPGVKGLVDQISIDPVSPMDDGIRRAVFRAIYGYAPLQQYAIVPSRPIRISVQNGRVTLYGVVDNSMDKQLAYMRAMQVPNVFHVTNDLVIGSSEPQQKSGK